MFLRFHFVLILARHEGDRDESSVSMPYSTLPLGLSVSAPPSNPIIVDLAVKSPRAGPVVGPSHIGSSLQPCHAGIAAVSYQAIFLLEPLSVVSIVTLPGSASP